MRINCADIQYNTDIIPVNVYNDSNHPVYAVDIYITSDNANFLLELLEEAEDGSVTLTIDGIHFQIKKGLPGESSLNPITYIKNEDIAKLIFRENNTTTVDATAIVGSVLDNKWEYGSNIANDDYISISYKQTTSLKDSSILSGYGLCPYGYEESNKVGYGGIAAGESPKDLYIVIEESKLISKDIMYLYSSLNPDVKESSNKGITYSGYNIEDSVLGIDFETCLVDEYGDYIFLYK